MKTCVLPFALVWALLCCPVALAQSPNETDLEVLRGEIRSMRMEYEARIADLEARLDAAERAAASAAAPADSAVRADADYGELMMTSPQTVSVARDSAFNPAIGVTFQGQAWAYDKDPEDSLIPGFRSAARPD